MASLLAQNLKRKTQALRFSRPDKWMISRANRLSTLINANRISAKTTERSGLSEMRLDSKLLWKCLQKVHMRHGTVLGKRILLADDQEGVRQAIKYLLELDDHAVTEARDGREAFDLFRAGHFDLVITDYAMPEMAGNALAAEIKRLTPVQPIIMITAYTREIVESDNPVDAVLNKPFSFKDLRATIARLLSNT
jgi:CheY-like chemotaxis protein